MVFAGAKAGVIHLTVAARQGKFAAGGGSLVINCTAYRLADAALKSCAAAGSLAGAAHAAKKRRQRFSQRGGHLPVGIVSLSPVKGDPKIRTAGPASPARIYIAHRSPEKRVCSNCRHLNYPHA